MILGLDDWWHEIGVRSASWSLITRGEIVETIGGAVQVSDDAPAQWQCEIALAAGNQLRGRDYEALVDYATTAGAVVEVTPRPFQDPRDDPHGYAAQLQSVTVGSASADGWSITLAGLADGYTLQRGDWLSVEAAGPGGGRIVRLYRVMAAATASGGSLGPVRVAPRIDAPIVAGLAVRLHEPIMLAVVVPSTVRRGQLSRASYAGGELALRQVLQEVAP